MPGQYALYRYFDESDYLLYVGKSGDIATRDSAHIRRSLWMQFAVRSTIEKYGSDEDVCDSERKAIEAEHPIFNRQYNDTPEAAERLRAYLERIGRLDLMPARLMVRITEPMTERDSLSDASEEDILGLLRRILTAATADHAKVRLQAVAVLEGYVDLPRGYELERLADLSQTGKGTAYKARRMVLPPPPATAVS